jgi:hypothetical protein
LIGEGYWEGLNFEPSRKAQNANVLIVDIVITRFAKNLNWSYFIFIRIIVSKVAT